jgi:hypothetical protein
MGLFKKIFFRKEKNLARFKIGKLLASRAMFCNDVLSLDIKYNSFETFVDFENIYLSPCLLKYYKTRGWFLNFLFKNVTNF